MSLIFSISLITAIAGCGIKKNSQVAPVTISNEIVAMSRLRAIADAEIRYQIDSGGSFATMDQLIEKGFLRDQTGGKLDGYTFDVRVSLNGFEATAVPKKFGITGTRSFYIDETRILRGADRGGDPATSSDPQA